MLTKLSKKQTAMLATVRDEWLQIGLRTGPTDRSKAEDAVRLAYQCAGLEPPKLFLWFGSPLAGCYAAGWLALLQKSGAQVGDQVRAQVGDQVRDQVWAQVRAQVGDQVGAQVGDQVRDQVWRSCWGQHDAWLSFYAYFLVAGLPGTDKIKGLLACARELSWWWPFEHCAVLTELPVYLERDDQNRLHSETRAALEYPDGFALYRWHGVTVPKEMILDAAWVTPERIQTEQNQEIRRCMIERIGWDAYLQKASAIEIQRDRFGALLELPQTARDQRNRFVRVKDPSTERQYALAVPVTTQTAHEGVAWTFGMTTAEYCPEQET